MIFIKILIFISMLVVGLSRIFSNLERKYQKSDAIIKLRSTTTFDEYLSEADIRLMKKIYNKPFKNGQLYSFSGVLHKIKLAPGFRTRWFDTCIDDLRVESVFWDQTEIPISDTTPLENETLTNVKGVVYKDAIYITQVNTGRDQINV